MSNRSSLLYNGELNVTGSGNAPSGILKKQILQKTVEQLGFVETINHPIVPPKSEATLTVSVESSSKICQ